MKLKVLNPQAPDDPWYAAGLQFGCTECGNCCTGAPGYVWITSEEIVCLAQHLKLTPEQVVEKYCRKINGRFSLTEHKNQTTGNYDCVFLREDPPKENETEPRRTCTVYPVRPLQCRTWPFWAHSLTSPRAWRLAAQNCPGIGRGEVFDRQRIEALRDAKEWPAAPPTTLNSR